jgi:tetratricopeptide (TPR) repeat protein
MLAEENLDLAIPKLQRAAEVGGSAPDAPRLLLADLLVRRGRFDEAANQYRTVLAADPSNARAHLGLGRLDYERYDLSEASAQLHSSCWADPRTRKAAGVLIAGIHRHRGETAAADQELKRAGELPPDVAWPDSFLDEVSQLRTGRKANCDRARQLHEQGHVKEAISLLQQTVRDYPHSDVAWLMLGQAFLGQDDWEAAEQALRAAVREAPDSDENLQYLGLALVGRHDDPAAAACFRKATELRPTNAEAQVLLGQSLMRQNDTAGALRAFRAAVRYHPESEEAHLLLAETLSGQGNRPEALLQLREALQLNPASKRAKDLQQKLNKQTPAPGP